MTRRLREFPNWSEIRPEYRERFRRETVVHEIGGATRLVVTTRTLPPPRKIYVDADGETVEAWEEGARLLPPPRQDPFLLWSVDSDGEPVAFWGSTPTLKSAAAVTRNRGLADLKS